jgi:cytochrome b561
MTPSSPRYTPAARALHWIVAVSVIGQLALGFWMIDLPNTGGVQAKWFNLHKSIGIILGLVILLRLAWRLTHPAPPLPAHIPAWQRTTAKIVHAAIYACLVVIPLSGFIGSSVTRYPIRFFGYPLPRWAAESPELKELCSQVHYTAIVILIVLVVVHIGKVLKHLLIDRDDVFQRMGWQTRRKSASTRAANEPVGSK